VYIYWDGFIKFLVGGFRLINELILKEIDIVQSQISRYDEQGVKIKGLCVTLWAALSVFGIQNPSNELLFIVLFIVVIFLALEWTYRIIQARFILRSKELENLLNGEAIGEYKYSINKAATGELYSAAEVRAVARSQKQFYIFYGCILLLTFLFFVEIG